MVEYKNDVWGENAVKDLKLLVFLTQLGLSVVFPLGGCVLVALWLYKQFHWGVWILVVGIALGLLCAIDAFRTTLKALKQMTEEKKDTPPKSFDEHD